MLTGDCMATGAVGARGAFLAETNVIRMEVNPVAASCDIYERKKNSWDTAPYDDHCSSRYVGGCGCASTSRNAASLCNPIRNCTRRTCQHPGLATNACLRLSRTLSTHTAQAMCEVMGSIHSERLSFPHDEHDSRHTPGRPASSRGGGADRYAGASGCSS
jgi:hypothetical protein